MAAGSPLLRDQMCPSGSEGTKGSGGGQALCQCRGLGWPFRAQLSGLSPGTGAQCCYSPLSRVGLLSPFGPPLNASSWTQSWSARRVQLGCSGGALANLAVLGGDDTPAFIEASGLRYSSLAQCQRWAWGHSWEGRGQTRARVS